MSLARVIKLYLCLLLLAVPAGGQLGAWAKGEVHPDAQRDLRAGALGLSGQVSLDGTWELYWGQHLGPGEIGSQTPLLAPFPRSWEGTTIGDLSLTADGMATYRLRVLLPEGMRQVGLRLPYFYGWHRLYANGRIVSEGGSFRGPGQPTTSPGAGFTAYVATSTSDLELIMQLASYGTAGGGTTESMRLGSADTVARTQALVMGFDGFIVSAIAFMALYHFVLAFLRRRDVSVLYFGLFCALISLRATAVGEAKMLHTIIGIEALAAWRLELITYYLGIPVLMTYLKALFPEEMPRRLHTWTMALMLALSAIILGTSSKIFSWTLPLVQLLTIVLTVFYLSCLVRAAMRQRDGAAKVLAGFIVLTACSILEIISLRLSLNLPRISAVGLYVFIFFQASFLAKRFNDAFLRLEHSEAQIRKLSAELVVQERVRTERKFLEQSLSQAQSVHSSLGAEAAQVPGISLASYYQPAEHAGGDWFGISYDAARARLYLLVGDVSGHDMMSALVTVATAGAFKGAMTLLQELGGERSVAQCLEHLAEVLNNAVHDSGQHAGKAMSIAILGLDLRHGKASYLNAGHTPVLQVRAGRVLPHLRPANPLGFGRGQRFATATLDLAAGDGLFLYTDGLTENVGPGGKKLSWRQLRLILASSGGPEATKAAILEEGARIWQGAPPKDDCSFLCLTWHGPAAA